MSFVSLVLHNLGTRPLRSVLTALAVTIGVTAAVALNVLTSSLEESAVSILETGNADFSVAEEGVGDMLHSTLDQSDVDLLAAEPGVASAMAIFIATNDLDAKHPLFIEIGIDPANLAEFGVTIVDGRAHGATAANEAILGYRAARDFGVSVGDTIALHSDDEPLTIVGIYRTGVSFGDAAAMMALPTAQAYHRQPGVYTMAFVRESPGTDEDALRARIEADLPHLVTVQTAEEFGRVDRTLALLQAANTGGTFLALFIGASGVMNTALLSFYDRIREFGLLRAVGWSRKRLLGLVFGESFVVSIVGAALGSLAGFLVTRVLQQAPELVGIFRPEFTAWVFGRALLLGITMAFLGALYPAIRAAELTPLAALRRE